jgi:DNA-binding NarL/FixJ family response regulator
MTPAQLPNLAEASPVIRVAIVRGPQATALAESLEALLAKAKGFTFSRFGYHSESGVKPDPAGFGVRDVVVATLGASQVTDTDPFQSLQRAFPHRSVLVTTTDPDSFDFFRVLEMGASDFLLPPLHCSGCGSSELLQTIQPENRSQSEGDLSRLSSVFGFNTNQQPKEIVCRNQK